MSLSSFESKAHEFLLESEAVLAKYLPFLLGTADAVETATGNVELVPITNAAGGAAEATLDAAESAQNGQLAAAMSAVASAVSDTKAAIGATKQVAAPTAASPSSSTPAT